MSFDSVSTDSRSIPPGCLFVALHGQSYDGHSFVTDALARGARAALVHRAVPGAPENLLIHVPDTLRALGDLAAWTRRRHSAMQVVAITGSSGKSTTKELMASICAVSYPEPKAVLKTEGNLNNLIGLPITLLRLNGSERVAVLEMGMNRPGEITRLSEIACPDYGLITNIGLAHAEGVGGSIAGVAAAKGELVRSLNKDATMVVNVDDPWVRSVTADFAGRRVTFGAGGEVQSHRIRDLGFDGIAFDLHVAGSSAAVRLRLVGAHNVSNALAAAALGHAMGFRLEVIVAGLERTVGMSMRMEVVRLRNGVTVINDAYNANPSSVEAALEALQRFSGRSVVVLGEMRELGAESRRAHQRIGEHVASLGIDQVILLGPETEHIAAGARAGGIHPSRIVRCNSHAEAAAQIVAQWRVGDTVLIKGSHSMRMEEIVRLLESAGNVN
jgi:UDP-N-acetylmuramoyl-tripeptide--D-alanyl-D-alanine ligase